MTIQCKSNEVLGISRSEITVGSETRFRLIAESLPHVAWIMLPDGSLEFINAQIYSFTGLPEGEYPEEGWLPLIHPEDHPCVMQSLAGPFSRGEPHELIFRLRHHSGDFRYVTSRSVPIHNREGKLERWVGTLTEIHDQYLADSQRNQHEERLRLATQAASVGIYECNLQSGDLYLCEILRTIIAFPANQNPTIRLLIRKLHPAERRETLMAFRRSLLSESDSFFNLAFRIVRDSGEECWVRQSGHTLFTEVRGEKRAARMLGTIIDITAAKRLEAELHDARKAAELANHAKSEFLANMSHEIRTPMTAILGFADLLAERLTIPENIEYIDIIRRNGNYLLELINNLLDLTKIEAGRLDIDTQKVSLASLVSEVRTLMEVRASAKNLTLEVDLSGPLPAWVMTDNTCVRQILVNLIGNAIKFTDQGSVRITVEVNLTEPLRTLEWTVTDTGIGIPADQHERIFEPFTQADSSETRRFGGTGLGLSISRRLAKRLGGTLTLQSQLGYGSQFCLALPLDPNACLMPLALPPMHPKTPPVTTLMKQLSGSILVADDQQDVRLALQYFLELAGSKVSSARNGAEALAMVSQAATLGKPFDAVLLDLQMPIMDGYQTVRLLRSGGFRPPIIAITANAMADDRRKCLDAGFDDHVCKPIDWRLLVETLDRHLKLKHRREKTEATTSYPAVKRMSVLIVEDHQHVREIMSIMLTKRGFEVQTAVDGLQAIQICEATPPQAVVMDLSLPDQHGYQVIGRLQSMQELAHTIFIAISGLGDDRDLTSSMQAGFHHHLVKPVNIEQLTDLLMHKKLS